MSSTGLGELGLSASQRILVDGSVALALGQWEALKAALDEAVGTDAEETMEEVLLQSYLFLGYPRALTALEMWRSRSGRPAPPASEDDFAFWTDRGVRVFGEVYGTAHESLRERIREIHPDLERWMITECYGKVLGRPGATLVDREVAIVGLLVGLGSPRQLHSHLRGALRVGATVEMVAEAVNRATEHIGSDCAREADSVWVEVRDRWLAPGDAAEEDR